MDPNNPVVRLCAEGMQAESQRQPSEAKRKFNEAWRAAVDDYEACIAAHYVARHQETADAFLEWNREALRRAELVNHKRIQAFLPSLHLNMGFAYDQIGKERDAQEHYREGHRHLDSLEPGPYSDVIRESLARRIRTLET